MTSPKADTRDKRSLGSHFERLWGNALLAVSQAEDDAAKAVQRLAESAGLSHEDLKATVRELTERLARQRKDLERGLDEGVRKALLRLRVPKRDELAEIRARMERVATRLDALGKA